MPDFRDSAEASGGRGAKDSPLNPPWRIDEGDSLEVGGSVSPPGSFEGASSMIDPLVEAPALTENPIAALEHNLRKLLKEAEKIRMSSQSQVDKRLDPDPHYLNRFLERARTHYESQNLEACQEILQEAHKLAPGNPEVVAFMQKVEKESKIRRAESDFAIRISQLKIESIKLFEEGRFSECVERFKLLSELEPENHDLRDYLQISREESEKHKLRQSNAAKAATHEDQDIQASAPSIPDPPSPPAIPANVTPAPVLNEPTKSQATGATETPVEEVAVADSSLVAPAPPFIWEEPPKPPVYRQTGITGSVLLSTRENLISTTISDPEHEPPAKTQETRMEMPISEFQPRDLTKLRKPAVPKEEADEISSEAQDEEDVAKKSKSVFMLALAALLASVVVTWLLLDLARKTKNPEIQSQVPDNVSVKEQIPPPIDLSKSTAELPGTLAQKAFKQGRFLEANRLCDSILQSDPGNQPALDLKQQIRTRLSNLAGQSMANRQWEKAIVLWSDILKVAPGDRGAIRQLDAARSNLRKQEQTDLAAKLASEKKIQDLHQQITGAVNASRYLPPAPGNAFELIQKLDALSPDDAFGRAKLNEILRELVAAANRSLQARNYASASALANQIQTYFPETPELKGLRENIKAEEARLAEAGNSWMQKAESAMSKGHYITPANDNALNYCNQLLAIQPQNPKALTLKKESLARAVTQAKSLVQESKYDDAKSVYSALLYLPQSENSFRLNSQELKSEIDKLTFNAYAVVHDHTIGSCSGRLRFNGYQIAFIPSADSKDGFTFKISEIVLVEGGDKLKLQFKGKTYRFQANATKNSQESRDKVGEMQQKLSALVTTASIASR